MADWKNQLKHPLVAAALCSLFVLPARMFGHEIAQAFRRAVNHLVSANDMLFELVSHSQSAADAVRSGQAWGVWIIYGFVSAALAMAITRLLVKQALRWQTIVLVCVAWFAIYLLVWRWDGEIRFSLTGFSVDKLDREWGPWPYAGSVGYFAGFIAGLIVIATPWRAGKTSK